MRKPASDVGKPSSDKFCRSNVGDSTSKDGAIVNVHVEALAFPSGINEFEEG